MCVLPVNILTAKPAKPPATASMYAGTGAGAGDFKVLPDDEIGVIAAPAELLEPIRLICLLSGSGNALRRYEAKVWQQDKHEKEGGKKCCFRRR